MSTTIPTNVYCQGCMRKRQVEGPNGVCDTCTKAWATAEICAALGNTKPLDKLRVERLGNTFAEMTPKQLAAWRVMWKRGLAERWVATTSEPGAPKDKSVEHHAPTAALCSFLVQRYLATHALSWVVSAPSQMKPDQLLAGLEK